MILQAQYSVKENNMTINLARVDFDNDIFTTVLPNGSYLIINKVDEDFVVDGGECVIKAVNLEIIDSDNNSVSCPCIIGMGNDLMKISTEYTEYEGGVLTPDNMVYCTIEIYE